jgi:cytidylate kinase
MKTIITIGREYGSAGHQIGEELGKKLSIPVYDKDLLDHAASASGICKEIFEHQDEKPTSSFLYSLVMDTYSFGYSSNLMNEMPLNQKVFLAQFNTIKKLAEEGSCIFIGRCADYALESNPNLLSVFIHAPLEMRVRRIAKIYDLANNKARDRINRTDKQRASYYNYYTSKKWGSTASYDMSIDSGIFGIDGSIDLIMRAVEVKENEPQRHIFD